MNKTDFEDKFEILIGKLNIFQQLKLAIFAARNVLPIWENEYPFDFRPRKCIEIAEEFLYNPYNNIPEKQTAWNNDEYIGWSSLRRTIEKAENVKNIWDKKNYVYKNIDCIPIQLSSAVYTAMWTVDSVVAMTNKYNKNKCTYIKLIADFAIDANPEMCSELIRYGNYILEENK